MIFLLIAILAGYAIGTLIKRRRSAYVLCFPVGAAVYSILKIAITTFGEEGIQYPDIYLILSAMFLQTPVLMLGVYLARRKAVRNNYES